MDDKLSKDDQLWWIALGAALASKEARERLGKLLCTEDVPEGVRSLWLAVKTNAATGVWSELESMLGVKRGECSNAVDAVGRALQARSLERYCREAAAKLQFTKGLLPDELLNVLDAAASKIRARQAAMGE
jgi:hypothetical protein